MSARNEKGTGIAAPGFHSKLRCALGEPWFQFRRGLKAHSADIHLYLWFGQILSANMGKIQSQ